MPNPEGNQDDALTDAVSHLESAARCLEGAAPLTGNLDLVARTHISSATALVEMLRKTQEDSTRARAAAAGA